MSASAFEAWRTGRKVGRTIYMQLGNEASDDDVLIGVMDSPELADDAVAAHNRLLVDRVDQLRSDIRELHRPETVARYDRAGSQWHSCVECHRPMPCPTVRLAGDSE